MRTILGKRIELERVRMGLSQIELAKKLHLSSSATISQYESGERTPSDDIKLKMCEIFDCSMDYLTGRTEERKPSIDSDKINIGLSIKDYVPPTPEQQKAIEEFAKLVLKENKKENKNDTK